MEQPHLDLTDDYGGGYGAWSIAEYLLREAMAVVRPEVTAKAL